MTDLKPCPFCGGEADPQGWKADDGRTGPECKSCGATGASEVDWQRRLIATAEMQRLQQALADAHALLVSYGEWAAHSEDLAHNAKLHFSAYRDKRPAS